MTLKRTLIQSGRKEANLRRPRILVVGSFVMDLIVTTEFFPCSGETVLGKSFRTAAGGKGANQAVQASRLGAEVKMSGKVGNDEFGKTLIASCKSSGIDVESVAVDDLVSSAVGDVILEESRGGGAKNRIIVVPGANMTIRVEEIAFIERILERYDMVMLQLEIPMAINEQIARYAAEKGVPVMLNSAPSAPLSDELLGCLAYICPNEHEAEAITGVAIRKNDGEANKDDIYSMAEVLLKKGVENVLVTLGSGGAALVNRDEFFLQPCIDVVEVKDPTAAGDSFVGSFVTGVCAGMDHEQALVFASYAATLAVSKTGAQPSLPYLTEVIDLLVREGEQRVDFQLLEILKR